MTDKSAGLENAALLSVIFQSCIFLSCKFSRPNVTSVQPGCREWLGRATEQNILNALFHISFEFTLLFKLDETFPRCINWEYVCLSYPCYSLTGRLLQLCVSDAISNAVITIATIRLRSDYDVSRAPASNLTQTENEHVSFSS